MGPTNNFYYLIQHLSAVLSKQNDQILQEQLGIGLSQYKILMVLEWNPLVQQKAIGESLGQTEASISRQIKLLKKKGLLNSKVDQSNKRKHISSPTTLGKQITEAATQLLRRSLTSDVNKINEDQLMNLNTSLLQLHKTICRPGKVGACDHQLGF